MLKNKINRIFYFKKIDWDIVGTFSIILCFVGVIIMSALSLVYLKKIFYIIDGGLVLYMGFYALASKPHEKRGTVLILKTITGVLLAGFILLLIIMLAT